MKPWAHLLAALALTASALAAAQPLLDPQEQEQIQDGLSGPEHLEVTPQILYQEANGFNATRSLLLNLETLFGDRYL